MTKTHRLGESPAVLLVDPISFTIQAPSFDRRIVTFDMSFFLGGTAAIPHWLVDYGHSRPSFRWCWK